MRKEFYRQFPTLLGLNATAEAIGTPEAAKQGVTDYRISFVLKYYRIAIEAGKAYGVHPLMLLAQASVESCWGTNPLATQYHNFFGLLAEEKNSLYWDGVYTRTKNLLKARVYKNARQSFFDFARLLSEHYKYAAGISNSIVLYADSIASSPELPYTGKDRMNVTKYRTLLIRSGVSILSITKVFNACMNN